MFVSLEVLLTSSLVRVAAPWDLIPLVEGWQLQVSVGVESVAALSWAQFFCVCSFFPASSLIGMHFS